MTFGFARRSDAMTDEEISLRHRALGRFSKNLPHRNGSGVFHLHVFIISPGKSFKNHTEAMQGQSPLNLIIHHYWCWPFPPLKTPLPALRCTIFWKLRSWNFCSLAVPFRTNMVKGVGMYYKLIIPKKNTKHLYRKKTRFKSEPS